MIVISSLIQLEKIWIEGKLNNPMYEYIKNIIEKSNQVVSKNKITIICEGKINGNSNYKLKWKRDSCIGGCFYIESFFINNDKGILLINRINATRE